MIKNIVTFLSTYKFSLLLLTLMAQIFIPVYFVDMIIHGMLSYLFMSLTLLSSIILFRNNKRHRLFKLYSLFIALVMLLIWLDYFSTNIQIVHVSRLLLVSSLYTAIFINIFKEFAKRKEVDLDFIFGAVAAFLLLGLLGSFLSVLIDVYYPGSFSFLTTPVDFQDYIYFNFVTLTTLGYGDVLPVTAQGQMHAVFVAIAGQLYLTITIGLIVGRYLMRGSK